MLSCLALCVWWFNSQCHPVCGWSFLDGNTDEVASAETSASHTQSQHQPVG